MRNNGQVVQMSQYKKRKRKKRRRRLRKPVRRFLTFMAFLLLLLIVFLFSRCAGKDKEPEETFPTETQAVETRDPEALFDIAASAEDDTEDEAEEESEAATRETYEIPTMIPLESSTEAVVEEEVLPYSLQGYLQRDKFLIAHAMGGIDSHAYGNCLESFQKAYDAGIRVFEADFSITADNHLVLWHDWKEPFNSAYKDGAVPLLDEFMATDIHDAYTAMSLKTTLKQMREHPDMVLIMDYKTTNADSAAQVYTYVVATAKANDCEDVLDRVTVTVYNKDSFRAIDEIYHFGSYLFNLSAVFKKAPGTKDLTEILNYCGENKIPMVLMNAGWFKKDHAAAAKKAGVAISVYTLNKSDNTKKLFDQGVKAIFTDYLTP